MPNSIQYAALANVLPQQRLLMYKKVFQTKNDLELHGAYVWSIKVAACIQPLLSSLEVALRNSIHISATNTIATDWYDKLSTRVRKDWKNQRRDTRNISWHQGQIRDTKKKLSKNIPPKGLTIHDLLVAKMDFGFWDNLLRECFSVNGDANALWPQCIPSVFPNLPKGFTNSLIQDEVSALRLIRNDIAHNSPVWKHKTVLNTQNAISYVNSKIDQIVEVIKWLSKEKVDWLELHMLQAEARRIASKEYLQLCQRKKINNSQENYSTYKRELRKKLKKLKKEEFNILKTKDGSLYMITKVTI